MDKLYPAPHVYMHPIDADDREIRESDVIEIKSPRGMIQAEAKISENVGPGLVAIDFGWGTRRIRNPDLTHRPPMRFRIPFQADTRIGFSSVRQKHHPRR